ncbi:MAG: aminoacyl-histidine dipeptidase [Lachnospiraceae bacterium]|nr:aminoacyl-histidine dipeptidase [Lachnospiraceae bacterium]
MSVLSELEPKLVFKYFEAITQIPHGSGNVEKISNYIADFAKERNLEYIQDDFKNVIIKKPASKGYENEPTVILQGHMDMVAVSEPGLDIDMKKDPLKLRLSGDIIDAEGTSLGGDDGIAVAYMMAILDDDSIMAPALECIFTVDEEVGMDGAREIDLSGLKGSRMINLDSEDEGIFLTSCAGGARVNCNLSFERVQWHGVAFEIEVGGLLGGHSGEMIKCERGNSNVLFGRVLLELNDKYNACILKAKGGLADNAIPRQTVFTVVIDENDEKSFKKTIKALENEIRDELGEKDPDFKITLKPGKKGTYNVISDVETAWLASYITALPNGVMANSSSVPGLVETSLNLGMLWLNEEETVLHADFSVRSSVNSAKDALIAKIRAVTELAGGFITVEGSYPGWKYRVDSPLRDKMVRVFEDMYGKKPEVKAIHAGLECGLLGDKLKDLDCVSIGPDMQDIHTTEEKLSVASTTRVWEFLIRVLAEKDN